MNVNSINPNVIATPKTAASNSTGNSAGNSASSATGGADKDTFLKLLVAQLKNQDPLAPQDGTQFVAQLAQFSALDQLISIKDLLTKATDNQATDNQASKTAK